MLHLVHVNPFSGSIFSYYIISLVRIEMVDNTELQNILSFFSTGNELRNVHMQL